MSEFVSSHVLFIAVITWIASITMTTLAYCAYLIKKTEADFYKREFEKLSGTQAKALEKVVDSHVERETWKKKAQKIPKLKLVASMGRSLEEAKVVYANFRNKPKKGPKNSGPKGAA